MKPIVCNEKATVYIPDTTDQCEYWLIPVHSLDDISNPDRNHAWILPNGDFYVYDGTELVLVNDLSDLTVSWGNITGSMSAQTDLMDEFAKYVKGITVSGVPIAMDSEQIVHLAGGGGGGSFDFAVGTILETSTNTNPSVYYGGTWTQVSAVDVLHVVGTMRFENVPAGATSMPTHTFADVVDMFETKYNYTPTDHWSMYASYNNGDGDTNSSHVEGATYLPATTQYYVLFTAESTENGALRVQYHYAYEIDSYKWVKTGA